MVHSSRSTYANGQEQGASCAQPGRARADAGAGRGRRGTDEGAVEREPAADPLHARGAGDVRLGAQRADPAQPVRAVPAARRAAAREARAYPPRGTDDLLFRRAEQCGTGHRGAARALLSSPPGARLSATCPLAAPPTGAFTAVAPSSI